MGADKVRKKYRGRTVAIYEEKRAGKTKWLLENEGVEKLLPKNIHTVLDVPVGTGRFASLYKDRGLLVTGVDTSPDMLAEARKKGITRLYQEDIRHMLFRVNSFDVAVCIRLFPWFTPEEVLEGMQELARVANTLIIGLRVKEGDAFCKNGSLWNHSFSDFCSWVRMINYDIAETFYIGNEGYNIYRLITIGGMV